MKVLLIGCVKSTEIFLKKLLEMDIDLVGVVTKKESSFNSDYVDIGEICRNEGVSYFYAESANSLEAVGYMKEKKPDILCCLGWSELLRDDVLNIAKITSIGFHPAALPSNRGRHPLIWALALGLDKTASTFFSMDSGADTGEILSQKEIEIWYEDDANSLYERVMDVAKVQLEEIILAHKNGRIMGNLQDKTTGNFWRKRKKRDGEIDWRMSSRSIYNLVRALTKPYVGAHFVVRDEEIKVWKVKEVYWENIENIEPGKILKGTDEGNPVIKAGENAIELMEFDSVRLIEGEYL